jgi:hypothetical protein
LDLLQEGPCTAMIHHQVEVVHYFHHVWCFWSCLGAAKTLVQTFQMQCGSFGFPSSDFHCHLGPQETVVASFTWPKLPWPWPSGPYTEPWRSHQRSQSCAVSPWLLSLHNKSSMAN